MGKKFFLFSLFAFLAAGFGFGGVSLAATVDCKEGNPVAKIGDEQCYATLAEAITADGATITLLNDVNITETVVIEKDLTIDLNGKNITATNARALWIKKGDVTITGDGTISANKSGNNSWADSSSVIRVGDSAANTNKAKLTIDTNVTVSSNHCYGITVFGRNTTTDSGNPIELVVNGKVNVTGTAAGISGNGSAGLSATTITIAASAEIFANNDEYAIYHPGNGTLTVDGKVKGNGGIEAKAGTVIINDGAKVEATANAQEQATNNNGTSTKGYVIASIGNPSYPGDPGDPVVTVNGGTVNGILIALQENSSADPGDINVSGGTFDSELAPEYIATDADKNNIHVNLNNAVAKVGNIEFSTLNNAIAAANDGETVEILKAGDYPLPGTIDKSITIEGVDGVKFSHTVTDKTNQIISTINEDVTFSGITFVLNGSDAQHHFGQAANKKITMNNCIIDGTLHVWGNMEFNKCEFKKNEAQNPNKYNLHINYGNVVFNDCEFTNDYSRNVNIAYGGDAEYNIEFNNTTFNYTATGDPEKAAVMIHEVREKVDYGYAGTVPDYNAGDAGGKTWVKGLWTVSFDEKSKVLNTYSSTLLGSNQLFGIDDAYAQDGTAKADPSSTDVSYGTNEGGNVKVLINGNQVYTTPKKDKSQWTVTFDGDSANKGVVNDGEKAIRPNDPTKSCYKFNGWYNGNTAYDFNSVVTSDLALTSNWTYTCSSGGGGGSSKTYSCKNLPDNAVKNNSTSPKSDTDYSYSTDTTKVCTFQCKSGYTWNSKDAKCEKSDANTNDENKVDETKDGDNNNNEGNNNGDNNNGGSNDGSSSTDKGFSQEFKDAYAFAHENGITTMGSIEEADMYGPLTRIAMAKMLSQYAINVLGKTPDTDRVVPNFPDVDAQLDADYDNGVTLAYQLGIMGIGIEEFRPFDLVTRAEFGTALSRMLYGTADGEGNEWYSTHLEKLMTEKIITNDNPQLQELRGYVMIMLMRSAQ